MLGPSKKTSLVSRVATGYTKSLKFLTIVISLEDKEEIKEGRRKNRKVFPSYIVSVRKRQRCDF